MRLLAQYTLNNTLPVNCAAEAACCQKATRDSGRQLQLMRAQGGCQLFDKYFERLEVSKFDIRSDYDDKVPIPKVEGRPVPRKYRAFLEYLPNWATMPDFHRVNLPQRNNAPASTPQRSFFGTAQRIATLQICRE